METAFCSVSVTGNLSGRSQVGHIREAKSNPPPSFRYRASKEPSDPQERVYRRENEVAFPP